MASEWTSGFTFWLLLDLCVPPVIRLCESFPLVQVIPWLLVR